MWLIFDYNCAKLLQPDALKKHGFIARLDGYDCKMSRRSVSLKEIKALLRNSARSNRVFTLQNVPNVLAAAREPWLKSKTCHRKQTSYFTIDFTYDKACQGIRYPHVTPFLYVSLMKTARCGSSSCRKCRGREKKTNVRQSVLLIRVFRRKNPIFAWDPRSRLPIPRCFP